MWDIIQNLGALAFVFGIAGALVYVGHRIADEQRYEERLRNVYGSASRRTK